MVLEREYVLLDVLLPLVFVPVRVAARQVPQSLDRLVAVRGHLVDDHLGVATGALDEYEHERAGNGVADHQANDADVAEKERDKLPQVVLALLRPRLFPPVVVPPSAPFAFHSGGDGGAGGGGDGRVVTAGFVVRRVKLASCTTTAVIGSGPPAPPRSRPAGRTGSRRHDAAVVVAAAVYRGDRDSVHITGPGTVGRRPVRARARALGGVFDVGRRLYGDCTRRRRRRALTTRRRTYAGRESLTF